MRIEATNNPNIYPANTHKNANGEKFAAEKPHSLQDGTILSSIHLETGDSIGIYQDETSTAAHPIMLAKVIAPDGTVREEKIDPKKVDPSNASYVEMMALSAYLKKEGKIDGVPGAFASMALASKDMSDNIFAQQDFLTNMDKMMKDLLQNGPMDTYVRYLKEFGLYSGWFTGKR